MAEQTAVQKAMEKAMSYVEEGEKPNNGLKVNENKLTEIGKQKQSETNKKISEISGERDKIENQLLKNSKTKKYKF